MDNTWALDMTERNSHDVHRGLVLKYDGRDRITLRRELESKLSTSVVS